MATAWILGATAAAGAELFHLPTANRSLLQPGGEERFYVGTAGRGWESGSFGCVRSQGGQMHEGIDIRALSRDRQGEATDPVFAAADGIVAYINAKPGLSTYGNYVILRHRIEGIDLFSLYAHLRSMDPALAVASSVKAGATIGIMGRTAATREGISKDRAHLHFELGLMRTDRFAQWVKATDPGQRNDHGNWNGRNFVGLDPARLFLEQRAKGTNFSLTGFIRAQEELCRVFVRQPEFAWAERHAPLIWKNPRAAREGIAGYEVALSFSGMPIQIIPRSTAEIPGTERFQLLSVNAEVHDKNPCRRIIRRGPARWELAPQGVQALELLAY